MKTDDHEPPPGRQRRVSERTRNGRIGVLGTPATVASGAYEPAVRVGRSFRVPEQAVHDYLDHAYVETA